MLSNALFLVASLAGLVAASPYPPCEHHTLCIDAINTCGIRYGACYDVCSPQDSPTPPPCPATSTSVEYPEITTD
ncbi:hypothetical protein LCI18_005362 [Fusarium solani-melongenae]|uniref:Uncharacterized protein n=1 Tax=Fusarium solani subsp. cucurbitae TaxID=2747967 RepID=A0ACD3YZN0_FUSSC|nr:hypothetical protein LCI18_005362 [Fusarium solani-melongenae]